MMDISEWIEHGIERDLWSSIVHSHATCIVMWSNIRSNEPGHLEYNSPIWGCTRSTAKDGV